MENVITLTSAGLVATATFHEFIAAEGVKVKWVSSVPEYATVTPTTDGNISTALIKPVDKTGNTPGVSVIVATAINPVSKDAKNPGLNSGRTAFAVAAVGDHATVARMSMALTVPVPEIVKPSKKRVKRFRKKQGLTLCGSGRKCFS